MFIRKVFFLTFVHFPDVALYPFLNRVCFEFGVRTLLFLNIPPFRRYGYVTSCPSNLGTGMRASVHLKIPNLTRGGSEEQAKAAAKPLGLSVSSALPNMIVLFF